MNPGGSTQQPQPDEQKALRLEPVGRGVNCHVHLYDAKGALLGSVTASRACEILKPEIARLVEEKAKGRY